MEGRRRHIQFRFAHVSLCFSGDILRPTESTVGCGFIVGALREAPTRRLSVIAGEGGSRTAPTEPGPLRTQRRRVPLHFGERLHHIVGIGRGPHQDVVEHAHVSGAEFIVLGQHIFLPVTIQSLL